MQPNRLDMTQDRIISSNIPQPRDAWDTLSMKEKAEMIGVAVRNGITSLKDIRQKYNEFAEGGSKEDEEVVNTNEQYLRTMEKVAEDNHQKWGFSNPDEALLHALNDNTYNYRGYYGKYPQSKANADTHWTDEFKTVWHPTFSNESIYSGQKSQYNPLGLPGGFWSGDTFIPMAWQIDANEYKKGGSIHIAPSKRGTFTAAAKKHGKSVQAFASQVLAHPENYSPAMRKKANFARNARHWKHGLGGNLFLTGGNTKASDYRYVLDDDGEWNRVANDEMGRVFQGLTVTPTGGSGQPVPARYRISYDAGVTKDDAAPIRSLFSKIQEIADTPIMVQQNPGTAVGYSSYGQYMPKSQSTYGDQANLLLTELTAPTALSDAKGIYQVFRYPAQTAKDIKSIFSEGTPAAEWARVRQRDSRLLDFGDIEDGAFKFTGFKESPLQMHLKRAKAKGYDTSDITYLDLSKDSQESRNFINDVAKREGLTPKEVKDFYLKHLNAHGHASSVKGTKIIIHDGIPENLESILSHEVDHALHYPKEPLPVEAYYPRIRTIHGDYFTQHNNTEISARGSQLHDYFGHTENEPITEGMLEYAKHHYVKDTGINNNMHDFLWMIKEPKTVAEWLTKYSTGIVPIGLYNLDIQKEKQ